jgi:uncharacterized membrane protein
MKFFHNPSYRILLGISGATLLVLVYLEQLFRFALMNAFQIVLVLSRNDSLYNIAAFASLVFLGLCYLAWRKRHHAWWVEVLCVLAFCVAILLGLIIWLSSEDLSSQDWRGL